MNTSLLTTEQAAAFLNCSPQTLNEWRRISCMGPRFIRRGRYVRYRVKDLERFLDEHSSEGPCQ